MSKYGVSFASSRNSHPFPVKELEDMTLEEIVQKHIRTCAKANGSLPECSKCKTPCKEGKRAIQLLSEKVYNDPPIPLYGGKTLIERAKEENMKRREAENKAVPVNSDNMGSLINALEKAKQEALGINKPQPVKESKKEKIKRGEWWEPSLASGDQITWLVENMGLSKTQAKSKIYQYKWAHGMIEGTSGRKKKVQEPKKAKDVKEENKQPEEQKIENGSIETKIEWLMHQQSKLEKEMAEYKKLYDEAKAKHEKIKQKVDILCSAMDILND